MNVTLENYEQKRQELVDLNSNLQGVVLREREKKADRILRELKEEYIRSCGGTVPYDMPTLRDENIHQSRLYAFCDAMPKGADLHVHDMALLPAEELVDLLMSCPEFIINKDKTFCDLKMADLSEELPQGYIRFPEAIESGYYTRDELICFWTTEGAKDSGKEIWDYFEQLFSRHSALSDTALFARKYYDRAFRYYLSRGIIHVEIHMMLTDSLDFSSEYVQAVREAYYGVKKEYPYFTLRIIGAGFKHDTENIDHTKKCFLNASYVQEIVKDESDPARPKNLVIGFDLVNEEDHSLPLRKFAPMLLKVKRQYPDMKLYIHSGESIEAGNDNLIDAYLLGASRVGHGFNLYRYPDLHARYAKEEICLEVCPISNERLGYAKDLRNHLATEYLKTGIVMALCSDDPAYMEYRTLTDDFFAATVCWDLGLAELKQFGINSIMYSGLDEEDKYRTLHQYSEMWNEFIDKVKTEAESCTK